MRFKAVIFDLGDTILNFGRFEVFKATKRAAGLSYDFLCSQGYRPGPFWLYFLRNTLLIHAHNIKSYITKRDFDSLEMIRVNGEKGGISLTDEQWEHLNWLWYKPLAEISTIEPDIRETLEKLQGMGLKLALLSNTFVNGSALEKHLEMAGILDMFPVRLYSCDFDFRKPDKRIFLEAARQLEIAPEEAIFVGDRIETDIIGSISSKMQPILKRTHRNRNKKVTPGVKTVDTLSELPALITTL